MCGAMKSNKLRRAKPTFYVYVQFTFYTAKHE